MEKKAKKEKKEKKIKLVKAKKIPGLFKKRYSQKALESKLLKKIYVPADMELVKKLFSADPKKPRLLKADTSGTITKAELKKLKKIAKDIKANKFGFKVVPFAAMVIFIAALSLGVILFKDVAAKKAIVAALQSVFDARTDVDSVHLELLNARLQVRNLQQASSSDDMKNVFQISDFTVDFNLTQALRGKVDIENVTVGEILFNTDRKKSGKLLKSKKEKKAKSAKTEKNSKGGGQKQQSDLMAKTQSTLNSMFEDYNPEKIYDNLQANLKSPLVAQQAQQLTMEMIEKWQKEPAKIEESVNEMKELTAQFQQIDYSKLNDPVKIKETIELVNTAINSGNSIAQKTKDIVAEVEKDSQTVKDYAAEVRAAVENDKSLVDREIAKFTALKDKGLKQVFNDMITAFVYGMAEQYSPYGRQILDKAQELKAKHDASAAKKNSDAKKAKKKAQKKRIAQRALGRYVYYKQDRVPRFLLEKAAGSGDGWSFDAREFSSDADKRNTQSLLDAKLSLYGIQNGLTAVIDARSNSKNPLLDADYDGRNIPMNVVIDSYGMKSDSDLDCKLLYSDSDGLHGSGELDLRDIKILTPSFEPEIIYEIYRDTLDSIQRMKINFDYRWSQEDGLSLGLETDAAEVFQNAFTSSFNSAISRISAQARELVISLLSEKTGIASDKIEEFTDIENLLKGSDKLVQDMKGELEGKKKELEDLVNGTADKLKKQAEEELAKAKAQAEAEAAKAKAQAEAEAAKAKAQAEAEAARLKAEVEAKARAEAERAKKEAEEAAKKEAKNMLKGFGF